jgi:hypothetical protein
MNYSEKLKDPRWQKKRLEIFQRDNFECQHCHETSITLNIHHLKYIKGNNPWEYDNKYLLTLCEDCHEIDYQYRKEAEQNILDSFALGKFCVDELNIAAGYILDHAEELKQLFFQDEWKQIRQWMDEHEFEKETVNDNKLA